MGLLKRRGNPESDEARPVGTQTAELERLLRDAVEERRALQATLASIQTHATDMPQLTASFTEMERRATSISQQLDHLADRMGHLGNVEDRLHGFDHRVAALETAVQKAEGNLRETLTGEAEVHARREALEQLLTLARDTLQATEAVKTHRDVLTTLEERVSAVQGDFQPLLGQYHTFRTDFEQLRLDYSTSLQDAAASREASQQALANAAKATDTLAELGRALGPLGQLQTINQETAAQLRALNTLAEHVAVKVKALESQQQVVDHALLESRRVHEMVWDLDVQIEKMREGTNLATRVE